MRKRQLTAIQLGKRVQNDIQDDVMRDANDLRDHLNVTDVHATWPSLGKCGSVA